MLRLLGFYAEFDDLRAQENAELPLLAHSIRRVGPADERDIVGYLDAGYLVLSLMEGANDVLTGRPHRRNLGAPSHLTDGRWIWRLDLGYYVETYHIELPEEFVDEVRRNGYEIPLVLLVAG